MSRLFQALKKAEAMPAAPESEPAPRAPAVAPVAASPLAAPPQPPPLAAPRVRSLGTPAPSAPLHAAVRAALPEQAIREMTSLRVSLESLFPERRPIVAALTGAQGGEGVSTVAAQFAISLAADSALRVLLADAGAQRPALLVESSPLGGLFEVAGVATAGGLIDLLPVSDEVRAAGLYVPAELDAALTPIRVNYDWIVIDVPSVLYSAEAASLAAIADGVVVVVEAGRTKKPVLGRAVDLLRKAGARVIGSVLNRRQLEIPEFIYRRI